MFKEFIEKLGYKLIDLHEHEFRKGSTKIAFATQEDLKPFANVDYNRLETVKDLWTYKKLSLQDYFKIYTESSQDSYRKDKSNDKDKLKIDIIKRYLR